MVSVVEEQYCTVSIVDELCWMVSVIGFETLDMRFWILRSSIQELHLDRNLLFHETDGSNKCI